MSDDGRFVGFHSSTQLDPDDGYYSRDVYLRDRMMGTTQRFSVANDGSDPTGPSQELAISGDGKVGAFLSEASNLVPPDFNGSEDLFAGRTPFGVQKLAEATALKRKITKFQRKAKTLKRKKRAKAAKRFVNKVRKLKRQLRAA